MMGKEKGRFLTGHSESGGQPAVSLSPGFCRSRCILLTAYVTQASQAALRREAEL